jgi:hypothetical protein
VRVLRGRHSVRPILIAALRAQHTVVEEGGPRQGSAYRGARMAGHMDSRRTVVLMTVWEKAVGARLVDAMARPVRVLRNYKISLGNRPC